MYIDKIGIQNFRTFADVHVDFVHSDLNAATLGLPVPKINNVNLILGGNGSGKTTLLKAIAIAALGPAITASGIPMYRVIRRQSVNGTTTTSYAAMSTVAATFTTHHQDYSNNLPPPYSLESRTNISRMGDIELPQWSHPSTEQWSPIFSNSSDAFFFVGYGATRRVESRDIYDPGARQSSSLARAQRVRSLFEEAYSLTPLTGWLPALRQADPLRFEQVISLVNKLLAGTGYEFTGELEDGEYLFESSGLSVPFPALSDGYRAYLGWIGDLIYHICQTCPKDRALNENQGLVMVDEIDLHLHPAWQMTVLPTLAAALPDVQFIVTSHSPLVVGSMEWMNILFMSAGEDGSSKVVRMPAEVYGLDADQILLTEYFGLRSTRAPGKNRELKELALAASQGDRAAAMRFMEELSGSTGDSK